MAKVRFVALNPDRSGTLKQVTVDTANVSKVRPTTRPTTFGGVASIPSTKVEMTDGKVYKLPEPYEAVKAVFYPEQDVREVECTLSVDVLASIVARSGNTEVRATLLDAIIQ